MIFAETELPGAFVIRPERIEDKRGWFARAFCRREFRAHNLNTDLVQCNMSCNVHKGTLRGMHFQHEPHAEAKLVRCIKGRLFDAIVDLRRDSPTFCRWTGVELSAENHTMLYVPEGFAHGYQTLEDDTEIFYQVTEYYHPSSEGGVRWDDPAFGIEWPLPNPILSEKDACWQSFPKV